MTSRKSSSEFSSERFRKTVADYGGQWGLIYDTLRCLCIAHPGHTYKNEVTAKLWIIGRTYATQIERKVTSDGTPGSALSTIADHVLAHGSEIDSWIGDIPATTERLSPEVIPSILRCHGRFVSLLALKTRNGDSVRSFASKYLHFHRPIIPVYDSVASATLRRLVRWQRGFDLQGVQPGDDDEYRWFVMRLLQFNDQARQAGLDPTICQLDWYLLESGE